MALLDWSLGLSVDVPEMDEQHKKLFALVNNLNEAMKQGRARDELVLVFDALAHYTQMHFAAEERFMASIGYPHLAQHKKEHAELMGQVAAFKADYDAGKAMISIKLLAFLRDWVCSHIQKSDKEYGAWVREDVKV